MSRARRTVAGVAVVGSLVAVPAVGLAATSFAQQPPPVPGPGVPIPPPPPGPGGPGMGHGPGGPGMGHGPGIPSPPPPGHF